MRKTAAESINAVITRYGQSPEFLGIYAQVGAAATRFLVLLKLKEKSMSILILGHPNIVSVFSDDAGKIRAYIERKSDNLYTYQFGSPDDKEVISFEVESEKIAEERILENAYDKKLKKTPAYPLSRNPLWKKEALENVKRWATNENYDKAFMLSPEKITESEGVSSEKQRYKDERKKFFDQIKQVEKKYPKVSLDWEGNDLVLGAERMIGLSFVKEYGISDEKYPDVMGMVRQI